MAPATLAVHRTGDAEHVRLRCCSARRRAAGVCWQCDHRSRLVLRAWSKRAGKSDRGGAHAELRRDHAGDEPRRRLRRASRNAGLADLVLVAPDSYIAPGHILFEQNCSSCHGTEATGSSIAPDLQGLGAGTIDFWLSTGRMPLANPSESAVEKPSRFTSTQILQIVAFVNSLRTPSAGSPGDTDCRTSREPTSTNGNALFVLNCAACHTITGSGDAIAGQQLRTVAPQRDGHPGRRGACAPVRGTCRDSVRAP